METLRNHKVLYVREYAQHLYHLLVLFEKQHFKKFRFFNFQQFHLFS
mgnify:CR=1 FL=1